MISLNGTSLVEDEGANVDGVNQDEAEREGGAADLECLDLNCASLCLTIAASMTEKWRKILKIAEGKMSLLQDAESLWTSMTERIK